jgi:hypothetical protein
VVLLYQYSNSLRIFYVNVLYFMEDRGKRRMKVFRIRIDAFKSQKMHSLRRYLSPVFNKLDIYLIFVYKYFFCAM